jgi:hypothetical protein
MENVEWDVLHKDKDTNMFVSKTRARIDDLKSELRILKDNLSQELIDYAEGQKALGWTEVKAFGEVDYEYRPGYWYLFSPGTRVPADCVCSWWAPSDDNLTVEQCEDLGDPP